MEKKIKEIIGFFAKNLRDSLGDKILGIYLFGSIAKGFYTEDRDIDLLIVYSDINERELLNIASNISFSIACKYGKLIESIPMDKKEFERSLGKSPFLWEVLKFGKPIYTTLTGTEGRVES